jgi:Bax protein
MAERESTDESNADVRARAIAGAFAVCLGVSAITALVVIETMTSPPKPSSPPSPRPRPKPTMFWARDNAPEIIEVDMAEPAADWNLSDIGDSVRRKEAFVRTLLPLVLAENDRIRGQRNLAKKDAPPSRLYERYNVAPGDRATLLRRIDIVPTSLALAQAAIESGWGTSRFVRSAKNLFGERTYKPNADGVAPKEGKGFKITRFASLAQSVRSYMHNLNSHAAYRDFRLARERLRRESERLRGLDLAGHLEAYSERGTAYVASVRRMIRENEMQRLDKARLIERLAQN